MKTLASIHLIGSRLRRIRARKTIAVAAIGLGLIGHGPRQSIALAGLERLDQRAGRALPCRWRSPRTR